MSDIKKFEKPRENMKMYAMQLKKGKWGELEILNLDYYNNKLKLVGAIKG